jgi:alginate O-acetyltransferase complex protein AlgI
MMRPWAAGDAAVVAPPQVVAMAFVAGGVCILQRLGVEKGIDWLALARRHAFLANSALALLFLAALAKGLAEPFKPFIYFRF